MAAKKETTTELLEKIAQTQTILDQDLTGWNPKTRPGKESQKTRAIDEMRALQQRYNQYVSTAAAVVVLKGAGDQTGFCQVAKDEAEALIVDGSALYRRLADGIAPSLGKRKDFAPAQMMILLAELEGVSRELDIVSFDTPVFKGAVCNNKAELTEHIASIIRSTLGTDLNRIFIRRQVLQLAAAAKASKNVIPVVVVSALDAEADALALSLFGAGVVVKTPETADKKAVHTAFTALKKRITGSKNN
jgi:hypothetical protein